MSKTITVTMRRSSRAVSRVSARIRSKARRLPAVVSSSVSVSDLAALSLDSTVMTGASFAPAMVTVPPNVDLREVDLALELQILSFYRHQAGPDAVGDPPAIGVDPIARSTAALAASFDRKPRTSAMKPRNSATVISG